MARRSGAAGARAGAAQGAGPCLGFVLGVEHARVLPC